MKQIVENIENDNFINEEVQTKANMTEKDIKKKKKYLK